MERPRLNKIGDQSRHPLTQNSNNRNPYTNRYTTREGRAIEREKEITYLNRIADLMNTDYASLTKHGKIKLWEDGENYQKVVKYVNNSQCHEDMKLSVVNIHRVWRHQDPDRLTGNRMFLWHGTKRANIPQILDTGFRIPSLKGQMYGSGIYFADRISKSANYCDQDSTFLLLCEVGLGKVHSCKTHHNDWTRPPVGYDSVKATGKYVPDWTDEGRYCGAGIPFGKTAKCTKYSDHAVNFNEFIVYDTQRIIIRFLVEVQVRKGYFPMQLIAPPNNFVTPRREVVPQKCIAPSSGSVASTAARLKLQTVTAAAASTIFTNTATSVARTNSLAAAPVYRASSSYRPPSTNNTALAQQNTNTKNQNTGGCAIL